MSSQVHQNGETLAADIKAKLKLDSKTSTLTSTSTISNGHECNGTSKKQVKTSQKNGAQKASQDKVTSVTSGDLTSDELTGARRKEVKGSTGEHASSLDGQKSDLTAPSSSLATANCTESLPDSGENLPDSGKSVPDLSPSVPEEESSSCEVRYVVYESELQMPDIMRLIQKDLSEPYSIYTYRYFIHNWPNLCFMAHVGEECVGAIVCKLDYHKKVVKRGYIAMLAVDSRFRKRKIGSTLVRKAIEAMIEQEADEVVLETEITNKSALRLYENLGFVRDKRLFRYYLNGVDALRLKLWFR